MAAEKQEDNKTREMRQVIQATPLYHRPPEISYQKQLIELERFQKQLSKLSRVDRAAMEAQYQQDQEDARSKPSEILDGFLFLGGYEAYRQAAKAGYSHIIKVTHKLHDDPRDQIFYALPPPRIIHHDMGKELRDDGQYWGTLKARLPEAFAHIDDAFHKGTKVLVHCTEGVSRSAAVVIAYLMWKFQVSFEEAHNHVLSKRPVVDTRFYEQLKADEEPIRGIVLPPQVAPAQAERGEKMEQEQLPPEFIQWLSLTQREAREAMRKERNNPQLSTSEYYFNLTPEQQIQIKAQYYAESAVRKNSVESKAEGVQEAPLLFQNMTPHFKMFFQKEAADGFKKMQKQLQEIGAEPLQNYGDYWTNLSAKEQQMFCDSYKAQHEGKSPLCGENRSQRISFQRRLSPVSAEDKKSCIVC
jgi:hypothetical protein